MSLTLTLCKDPSAWDAFVAGSPQRSIFCRSAYLSALDREYHVWLVTENGETQAGAVILPEDEESSEAGCPFVMYQGLLFSADGLGLPPHSRTPWSLRVTETLLKELGERYDRLTLCVHHSVDDLRSFQWFHYDIPEMGQVKLDLNYTGLVDLTTVPNFETYLTTIRPSRRYKYRRALELALTVEASQDVEILDHLQRLSFERQGLQRTKEEERLLRSITSAALHGGYGELLICRDRSWRALSATLFLFDDRCGYYLFGGNDPAYRAAHSGTLLFLENIRRCFARGLKTLDVCGMNSPNRGNFKSSFNASVVPYFTATWAKPLAKRTVQGHLVEKDGVVGFR